MQFSVIPITGITTHFSYLESEERTPVPGVLAWLKVSFVLLCNSSTPLTGKLLKLFAFAFSPPERQTSDKTLPCWLKFKTEAPF